jgi:hypothetical protein
MPIPMTSWGELGKCLENEAQHKITCASFIRSWERPSSYLNGEDCFYKIIAPWSINVFQSSYENRTFIFVFKNAMNGTYHHNLFKIKLK